jgi:hypothetical protein
MFRVVLPPIGKGKGKGRYLGRFRHCSRVDLLYPCPQDFPHSSPEAPRTTQARETSASKGGNYTGIWLARTY